MITSSVNKENFIFFFPNLYTFHLISCPISLAMTSSTVMRRSGKRRPSLPYSDLSRKALSLKYDVSYRFLKDILYQVEEVSNTSEKFVEISLIRNLQKLGLEGRWSNNHIQKVFINKSLSI